MELMTSSFALAIAAALSIILAQASNKVSVNYVSMAIGIIMGLIPFLNSQVAGFDSHIFMELIIAPLLFFEGQTTRFHNVRQNLKGIIGITVVMVILALIAAGFGAAWIGELSLPLAFIIASISTPTDATATDAVTEGLEVPGRVERSLKMESLFNDASGLILLDMTVLWFTNGYINYRQTIIQFLYSSIGGVLVGFLLAWLIIIIRQLLLRSSFNSLNAQNLIYMFTPLFIYVVAEHFELSGILAVVVAGLIHNAEANQSMLLNSRQVHMGRDLRNLITEIFNSMVFVILGIMMVRISKNRLGNYFTWTWILVGIAIYVANLLVRYLYSWLIMKFSQRDAVIFALGGVHGAVTLSLALTVSSRLLGSTNYNLVIMSEAVLIILSMLVPTLIFQFILPHEVSNDDALEVIKRIRTDMVREAVKTVHKMYLPKRVKRYVIYILYTQKQAISTKESLRALLATINQPDFTQEERTLIRMAFFRAFDVERQYLEMNAQKESEYREYLVKLYNDVLLGETLILDSTLN